MIDSSSEPTPRQRELLARFKDLTAEYATAVLETIGGDVGARLAALVNAGAVDLAVTVQGRPFVVSVLACPKDGRDPMIIHTAGLEEDNGAGSPEKLDA